MSTHHHRQQKERQQQLFESDRLEPDDHQWYIDPRTKELGREGIQLARRVLAEHPPSVEPHRSKSHSPRVSPKLAA
jgi:hypothetical protein